MRTWRRSWRAVTSSSWTQISTNRSWSSSWEWLWRETRMTDLVTSLRWVVPLFCSYGKSCCKLEQYILNWAVVSTSFCNIFCMLYFIKRKLQPNWRSYKVATDKHLCMTSLHVENDKISLLNWLILVNLLALCCRFLLYQDSCEELSNFLDFGPKNCSFTVTREVYFTVSVNCMWKVINRHTHIRIML